MELIMEKFTHPALAGLLEVSSRTHAHICPRQVLGVRMGLLAARFLDLELPQKDKRLHAFVETDGCALDGITVATGCQVGRRTLHVLDFGKIAATFVDSRDGRAVRIRPHQQARDRWAEFAPDAPDRWHGYLAAYQVMPDELLMVAEPVTLTVSLAALISHEEARAICDRCGEEIFNEREIIRGREILCRSCAGQDYYTRMD
jgi:formylmethanofuran dehydrogenase subunit E